MIHYRREAEALAEYVLIGFVIVIGGALTIALSPLWIPLAAVGWLAKRTGLADYLS